MGWGLRMITTLLESFIFYFLLSMCATCLVVIMIRLIGIQINLEALYKLALEKRYLK